MRKSLTYPMYPSTKPLRIVLALLSVTAVLTAAVPATAASEQVIGHPDLSIVAPSNQFAPGEEATLQLFVTNDGRLRRAGPATYVDRVTTARATTASIDTRALPIDVETGRIPVGIVPVGTHGPFEINLTIPEQVPPGTYELPVQLRYTYTYFVEYDPEDPDVDPTFSDTTITKRIRVPIVVEDSPRFAVVGTATSAAVGDRGEFALDLQNVGTEAARDVRVAASSESADLTFGGERGTSAFAGVLAPGERVSLTYPVELADDALVRNYTVNVAVGYTDVQGIQQTGRPLVTALRPQPEQSFAVVGVESDLRVGDEGRFAGVLVNEGPLAVRSPVVVLDVNSPNVEATEVEYALPDLGPGERAPFSFDVEVSDTTDAGSREFTVAVRYRNEAGDERRSDRLGVRVAVEERRDVFRVERVQTTLVAGERAELRLQVTNVGEEPLREIRAKAFFNDPLSSENDEAFVDELASGESAEIVFDVSTSGGTVAKAYPVALDFEYEEPDGDTRLTDTVRVPVDVETQRRGSGGNLPLIAVGVAGLVIVAGVLYWRRR